MSDRPRATIVELFADKLGQPLEGRKGNFYICTIKEAPELSDPYADYPEAEQRSRGNFTLISPGEVHSRIWTADEEEAQEVEPEEVEAQQSIWHDNETGIGVWEAVVWSGGQRILAERRPQKRFWIRQEGNPVPLAMASTPRKAIDKAKEEVSKAQKQMELAAKEIPPPTEGSLGL